MQELLSMLMRIGDAVDDPFCSVMMRSSGMGELIITARWIEHRKLKEFSFAIPTIEIHRCKTPEMILDGFIKRLMEYRKSIATGENKPDKTGD